MLHINTVHVQRETLWVKLLAGEEYRMICSAWACKHTYIAESFVGLCTHSSVWKVSNAHRQGCKLVRSEKGDKLTPPPGKLIHIAHYTHNGKSNCFIGRKCYTLQKKNAFLTFLSCFQSKYLILKLNLFFSRKNNKSKESCFRFEIRLFCLPHLQIILLVLRKNSFGKIAFFFLKIFRYIWTRNKTKTLSRKAFFAVHHSRINTFI